MDLHKSSTRVFWVNSSKFLHAIFLKHPTLLLGLPLPLLLLVSPVVTLFFDVSLFIIWPNNGVCHCLKVAYNGVDSLSFSSSVISYFGCPKYLHHLSHIFIDCKLFPMRSFTFQDSPPYSKMASIYCFSTLWHTLKVTHYIQYFSSSQMRFPWVTLGQ